MMFIFSDANQATSTTTILGYGKRTHLRPLFLHALIVSAVFFSFAHGYAQHYATLSNQTTQDITLSVALRPTPKSVAPISATPAPVTPAAAPAPQQTAAQVIIPAVPNCTPASYTLPSQLDLSNAAPGITEVIDTPQQYQIFGNTSSQIHAQLQNCVPQAPNISGKFTAYTSYAANITYDYTNDGTGQCTLTDVKVGLHMNQIFPVWQPTANTVAGLANSWQAFMAGLHLHEQGQVTLNEQYAQIILSDMQHFPATSCGTITQAVTAKFQGDLAALNQAHNAYEAQTNYGATQGALVP